MSQREARARGIHIYHRDTERQRIQGSTEVWLRGSKKIEIFPQDGTAGKSTDPHYVREISPHNGQVINVSQAYHNRAVARGAALRHFPKFAGQGWQPTNDYRVVWPSGNVVQVSGKREADSLVTLGAIVERKFVRMDEDWRQVQ